MFPAISAGIPLPGTSLFAVRKRRVRTPPDPAARQPRRVAPLPAARGHATRGPFHPHAMARAARRHWLVLGLMAVALLLHLWGIRRDLPYITEDPIFMDGAVRIASSGNLNPGRFNHPGSTLIYPLAVAFRLWDAAAYGGPLFHADPSLNGRFQSHTAAFCLVARLLTVVYAVASVPIVYQIGTVTAGATGGLIGALFAALHPTEVFGKCVRTDSASLFFGLIALWSCLRLYAHPTWRNQLLAGGAIGLAIGTKYYLGTLVAVLVTVDVSIISRRAALGLSLMTVWRDMVAGLAAVALAFGFSTPYFFLDYAAASSNLRTELRSVSIGSDGLPPTGNFLWYLGVALPQSISWPQVIAASLGLAVAARERQPQQALLVLFATTFLVGISLHPLHWARWLIPILPVVALFAAQGLEMTVRHLGDRLSVPLLWRRVAVLLGVVLLAWDPTRAVVEIDRLHTHPSTGVVARQWITENLPPGSWLAFEWQTLPPPLDAQPIDLGHWVARDFGRNFTELSMSKLAVRGTVTYYKREGFRYLVTSSLFYDYYPAHADAYPTEAAFYRALLTEGRLLQRVTPSASRQGSEIRIYEIR